MLVVCRAATVTLLSVEIEANVLVNRQLATMLISAGYNHAGPGHRQVLNPVIDELAADVAERLVDVPSSATRSMATSRSTGGGGGVRSG